MLDRAHRIVNPLDFKRVVRRGTRVSGKFVVVYLDNPMSHQPRVGFIVAKSVGGAVTRNMVKRRLRAASATLLDVIRGELVVRALPASASATYAQLRLDLLSLVERANSRSSE